MEASFRGSFCFYDNKKVARIGNPIQSYFFHFILIHLQILLTFPRVNDRAEHFEFDFFCFFEVFVNVATKCTFYDFIFFQQTKCIV